MAWKKILNFPNTGFGIFLLAFAFVLFFSFFLGTHNTFATDYTYNIVNGTDTVICKASSSDPSPIPLCSDLKYVTFSSDSVFNGSIRPTFSFDRSSSLDCSSSAASAVYLPFNVSSSVTLSDLSGICSIRFGSTFSLSGSTNQWTVLVSTDPLGTCPVCEECQQCPAVPENPYDDKFDKIIVAIYTCGAIILVIYFFYCIYGMIIKSTGGK